MAVRISYIPGALETAAVLLIAWALVFLVPFRWTSRWLGATSAPIDTSPALAETVLKARRAIRFVRPVAVRLPWTSTCLVRAVAGTLLLKRRGIASRIRLGVIKSDEKLTAHAWLMVANEAIIGGENSSDYTPLADVGDVRR